MTLILDYAWQKPTPAQIKAAGYSGVLRYLSPDASKNLSAAERDGLLAAGLSIGVVWESTANRASQGILAGAADVAAAETQARSLGLPAGVPIFYAVDFDADPASVAPYFAGVMGHASHTVGVYGSARVIEGTNVPWKWQTVAWSGGRVSGAAHIYQRLSATVPHPIPSSDENLLLHPVPMWSRFAPPPMPPVPPLVIPRDPALIKRLQVAVRCVEDGFMGTNTATASDVIIEGKRADTRYLQWHCGLNGSAVDGVWGPTSQAAWLAAIAKIQAVIGVTADGSWGPISQARWVSVFNANYLKA
jgi:hypothetical protein